MRISLSRCQSRTRQPHPTRADGFGGITTKRDQGSSFWPLRMAGRWGSIQPGLTLMVCAEGCAVREKVNLHGLVGLLPFYTLQLRIGNIANARSRVRIWDVAAWLSSDSQTGADRIAGSVPSAPGRRDRPMLPAALESVRHSIRALDDHRELRSLR
jgi:hypothetical protein